MPDIVVQIDEYNFDVTIENKPALNVVVESTPENSLDIVIDTIKGNSSGGSTLIQTKIYPLSGFSATIPSTTHGFIDLLNFYVVKPDLTQVEVVFFINNNNDILVLSNVSLNNHSIIIKGYN